MKPIYTSNLYNFFYISERRISQHLKSLTSTETSIEVEQAQDKTLEDLEDMDDMRMGVRSQASRKTSAPASLSTGSHMLHTAKGERRFREKVEREGIDNLPAEEQGKMRTLVIDSISFSNFILKYIFMHFYNAFSSF